MAEQSAPAVQVRVSWETAPSEELRQEIRRLRELFAGVEPEGIPDDSTAIPLLPTPADDRVSVLIIAASKDVVNWTFLAGVEAPDDANDDDDDANDDDANDDDANDDDANDDDANDDANDEDASERASSAFREAARRFGGARRASELVERWLAHNPRPAVAYHVHFHLTAADWRCRTLPTSISKKSEDAPALAISQNATVVQVGYAFVQGAHGLSRVDLEWREKSNAYHVYGVAHGLLRIGTDRLVPFGDEVQGVILDTLFERTK